MPSPVPAVLVLATLVLAACGHAPPDAGPGDAPPGPERPRVQLFLSPAGEPFRAPAGAAYPVAAWFAAADADRDGALSRDETVADALRFFTRLDTNRDGVLEGLEISAYETQVAPEILGGDLAGAGGRPRGGDGGGPRGGRRGGGGLTGGVLQGASPYGLLREPQPVMGADGDFNRRVTRDEAAKAARARFALLDTDGDGRLTLAQLPATPVQARAAGPRPKGRDRPPRP